MIFVWEGSRGNFLLKPNNLNDFQNNYLPRIYRIIDNK